MRRKLFLSVAGASILPALCLLAVRADELKIGPSKKSAGSCAKHGTSVDFVSTPSEAARKAKKEEKLVFVLHVSGHFEDPKLT